MTDREPVALFRADQCRCWRMGERVPVETYLERHAALREEPEAVLDLILNEVILREAAGESPPLEEYLRRFSWLREELPLLFEVHQALAPVGEPESGAPDDQTVSATTRPTHRSPAAAESAAIAVPGYEIQAELGRGGMGVVYRARQLGLKRPVALKMVLAGAHAGPKVLARFQTEAEAVARLQHPNIVQIYEVGERDECPYLCLELVEGGSLDNKLGGTPQPAREAACLAETLARTMQYVHRHGILHRDLKPSNVLLTAEGIPKITDFGLAKLMDSESGQTPSEAFLGTPSYMAPEQAAGRPRAIGELSDVYALGAILYELLTGRPPFRAATPLDTMMLVISQEPVAPTRLEPKVPRDLETICLKCLEKEPHQRYPDAGALADDLARFLAGEPIRARPINALQRGIKWARRRPSIAVMAGVCIAAVLTLVTLAIWLAAADRKLEEQRARQAARDRFARFNHGRDEVLFRATLSLDSDSDEIRQAAWRAAHEAFVSVGLTLEGEDRPVFDPAFDRGERDAIALGGYELLLVLADALTQPLSRQAPEDHRARVAEALRLLDRAAALRPPTRAYHLRRARCLAILGDEAAARQQRAQAATLQPAGALDAFLAGVDLFMHGEGSAGQRGLKEAIRDFEQAQQLQPDHFWAQYYLAACELNTGHPDLAKVHLDACLKQRADFAWIPLLRGFAQSQLHEFEAAEADFQKVLELGPDEDARYALFVHRGALRLEQGRPDEASADEEQAIALKPQRYQAYGNLALLRMKQGRYREAAERLDQAIRLGPPDLVLAKLQADRAHLFLLTGWLGKAVRASDALLAAHPDATDALGVRGQALLELGEYAASVRSFTQYLERGGAPLADIYRGRGQARMKLGHYPGAVDDYTEALKLKPDREIWMHRGWAYFFTESPRLALLDFEKSLRLDPSGIEALIGRGLARVALGQDQEAVADAEEALRRPPTSPEMSHNIACIFARAAGRRDPAGHYHHQAVAALRHALGQLSVDARLPFWRDKVLTDSYLEPIRRSPEFLQLERQLEEDPRRTAP